MGKLIRRFAFASPRDLPKNNVGGRAAIRAVIQFRHGIGEANYDVID